MARTFLDDDSETTPAGAHSAAGGGAGSGYARSHGTSHSGHVAEPSPASQLLRELDFEDVSTLEALSLLLAALVAVGAAARKRAAASRAHFHTARCRLASLNLFAPTAPLVAALLLMSFLSHGLDGDVAAAEALRKAAAALADVLTGVPPSTRFALCLLVDYRLPVSDQRDSPPSAAATDCGEPQTTGTAAAAALAHEILPVSASPAAYAVNPPADDDACEARSLHKHIMKSSLLAGTKPVSVACDIGVSASAAADSCVTVAATAVSRSESSPSDAEAALRADVALVARYTARFNDVVFGGDRLREEELASLVHIQDQVSATVKRMVDATAAHAGARGPQGAPRESVDLAAALQLLRDLQRPGCTLAFSSFAAVAAVVTNLHGAVPVDAAAAAVSTCTVSTGAAATGAVATAAAISGPLTSYVFAPRLGGVAGTHCLSAQLAEVSDPFGSSSSSFCSSSASASTASTIGSLVSESSTSPVSLSFGVCPGTCAFKAGSATQHPCFALLHPAALCLLQLIAASAGSPVDARSTTAAQTSSAAAACACYASCSCSSSAAEPGAASLAGVPVKPLAAASAPPASFLSAGLGLSRLASGGAMLHWHQIIADGLPPEHRPPVSAPAQLRSDFLGSASARVRAGVAAAICVITTLSASAPRERAPRPLDGVHSDGGALAPPPASLALSLPLVPLALPPLLHVSNAGLDVVARCHEHDDDGFSSFVLHGSLGSGCGADAIGVQGSGSDLDHDDEFAAALLLRAPSSLSADAVGEAAGAEIGQATLVRAMQLLSLHSGPAAEAADQVAGASHSSKPRAESRGHAGDSAEACVAAASEVLQPPSTSAVSASPTANASVPAAAMQFNPRFTALTSREHPYGKRLLVGLRDSGSDRLGLSASAAASKHLIVTGLHGPAAPLLVDAKELLLPTSHGAGLGLSSEADSASPRAHPASNGDALSTLADLRHPAAIRFDSPCNFSANSYVASSTTSGDAAKLMLGDQSLGRAVRLESHAELESDCFLLSP